MAQRTRISIARNDIFEHFNGAPKKVYRQKDLAQILQQQRSFWRLAHAMTTGAFIDFLIKQGKLRHVDLRSDSYNEKIARYCWGEVSIYELAVTLRANAYLSHGTAVFLHGLTNLIPKIIYLNAEQSAKPRPSGELTQSSLDRAFAGKQRQSNLAFKHDGWTLTVVAGKNTSRLGVELLQGPGGEQIPATNLERTLIDIVVRPSYAGGIFQVLEAYKSAKERVSVNRLVSSLKKLDYIYPYQQAIGFLMQLAGYERDRYTLLLELKSRFDFHLLHGISKPNYDDTWQLYYPPGLKDETSRRTKSK
jgi:hypothetical protein